MRLHRQHMIDHGKKIFQLVFLHKTNLPFIITHVKTIISCRHRVEEKIRLNPSLLVTITSLMIHYFFLRKKLLDYTMKLIPANENRHS